MRSLWCVTDENEASAGLNYKTVINVAEIISHLFQEKAIEAI